MKASVERVVSALARAGITAEIKEFSEGTRTAEEAAAAIGVTVGQIVKSLVFLAGSQPILALVSGPNRASAEKLAELTGATITRPDAATVRRLTGFSIGGVPPVGHSDRLPAFCDPALLRYQMVWAAAGTPNSVFALSPSQLVHLTDAQVADICVSE
ncbi:MAG: YbaK/EbsC family protein [Ktedonobacterales bacterium]